MSDPLAFTSNKPYLFRAILEWLLDNEGTPYVLVDATRPNVNVPQEHIKDGQIVLNINPSAVNNWFVDETAISFNARFSGKSRDIYVPMPALLAIYAQENGQGMAFPVHESELTQDESFDQASSESEKLSEQDDDTLNRSEPPKSVVSTKESSLVKSIDSNKKKGLVEGKNKKSHLSIVK